MLTEESKRRLYASARDETERQRLLAIFQAYQQDGETESMHALFGHLARGTLIGGVALAFAALVYWTGQLAEGLVSERTLFMAAIGGFVITLMAISVSFWGDAGTKRENKWRLAAQRYGFPLILALGISIGYLSHSVFLRHSDTHLAKEIAVKACLASSQCLVRAREFNGGEDVRWVLMR